jgi:HK97 family phage prohead protease
MKGNLAMKGNTYMDKQKFRFDVKTDDEAGTFEGYVSTFGNTDLGGDKVIAGAFEEDLKVNGARRPVLWAHNTNEPIGYIDVGETARGLYGKGKLLLDVQRAREIAVLMKAGVVSKMSMGYQTLVEKFVNGTRELRKVKLFEASAVVFPMNPAAVITSAKEDDELRRAFLKAWLKGLKQMNASLHGDDPMAWRRNL